MAYPRIHEVGGRSYPRMVTENGVASLEPLDSDVTHDEDLGARTVLLSGVTAEFAVEALGRRSKLFVDGVQYALVDVRLEEVR